MSFTSMPSRRPCDDDSSSDPDAGDRDAAHSGLAGAVPGPLGLRMTAAVVRQLLEAARTSVDAALKLLDGPTGPGAGPAAIPPAGPGVPGIVGPSSTLTSSAVTACPHPAAQRQAIGGFGGEATGSFHCRACGVTVRG
jgi:hypothetical protein